ncbi:GNAT family N-acetyltransferase [Intrasporangium sp.]|uniref:GNAT family N-acetyltransferase n=1 Tax=Intrasporangium sp. TaxID=1925024 RepID=UPI0033656BB9
MKGTSIQSELLRVFHETCRLVLPPPMEGYRVEWDGPIRREYGIDPTKHATVDCPVGLGADPAAYGSLIARQRDFFRARGQELEWKTYDYDEPRDLGARLIAAGFVKEDDEALILGEALPLAEQDLSLPDRLVIRAVDRKDDFDRIRDLYRRVWGDDPAWISGTLYERWEAEPGSIDVVVIEESRDGPVLCSARSEYDASPFTGLWGGSTDPDWRGRGLYRATLLHRARLGLARGKDYVRVDASPDSEPILRRLGLHRVATTTPYVLTP